MADKLTKADLEAMERIAATLKPLLAGITLQLEAQSGALKDQSKQFNLNKTAVNDFLTALKEGKETQEALTSAVNKAIAPYQSVATAQDKINLKINTAKTAFTEIVNLLREQGKLDDDAAKKLNERVKNLKIAAAEEKAAAKDRSTAGLEKKVAGTQAVQFAGVGVPIVQTATKATQGTAAPGGDAAAALLVIAKKLGLTKVLGGIGGVVSGAGSEFIAGVKDSNLAINELAAGFAKLTGQVMMTDFAVQKGDDTYPTFAQRLIEIQRIAKDLGIGLKEVAETFTTLMTKSRAFGTMTRTGTSLAMREQAVELARLAVEFSAVGIKAENFAGIIDELGKTFKVRDIEGETKILATRMVNLARVTGQTTDVVAKDFGVAMEHLAAYPLSVAQTEFEKLSIIAASTGVSMESLLKTASGFDDMEKAAGSVGDLNAMLGGPYLNTLDMVNKTEAERIEYLQEAMAESGKSWNEMDRFMKKAIAGSAGLSLKDASRVFGHQRDEIRSTIELQKEQLEMMEGPMAKKYHASYKQLIETEGDGARRHAVSLQKRLAAVKESMTVDAGAYEQMEEMAYDMMNEISNVADKVRAYVAKQAVGALRVLDEAITEIVKKIKRNEIPAALADIATLSFDILESILKGGEPEPGAPEPRKEPTKGKLRQPIPVTVVNPPTPGTITAAAGASTPPEEGEGTGEPRVALAGGGQEFALTQNIVLKLDGDILHEQVTKSIEKILPGMWS